jgi:Raf kinase inhibitor-like YbhB/YbcL family protein
MQLDSPAYPDEGAIPIEYATRRAGGDNVSVPYEWSGAPEGTKSFALAVIDVSSRNWVHWLVVDIPARVSSLAAGASRRSMPEGARELDNTFGDTGWGGPQPPPGTGEHRYVATVYALDSEKADVHQDASFAEFERAVAAHVLAKADHAGLLGK